MRVQSFQSHRLADSLIFFKDTDDISCNIVSVWRRLMIIITFIVSAFKLVMIGERDLSSLTQKCSCRKISLYVQHSI